MTPEEKAVIEAAMTLSAEGRNDHWTACSVEVAVEALIRSCPDCNRGGHTCPGDGNAIGHTQTDCGDHEERDEFSAPRGGFTGIVNKPGIEIVEWLPATFAQCLAGDRIRLGAEETDVLSSSTGTWHVGKETSRHPVSWEHTELRMDLAANPGLQQYPPNTACEILCTPERKALLLMQQAFPGSAIVSSDVD